ncbi:hypothetical protein FACS1894189_0150 [Planctomycetales bacterium]|nr:hypothetical protein FACS1894189_0150 [Planctomycetales bacterium]
MAKWFYYDNDGQKVGPIRGRDLSALAKNGAITPKTIVENEQGVKAAAAKVQGLTFSPKPVGISLEKREKTVEPIAPPQLGTPAPNAPAPVPKWYFYDKNNVRQGLITDEQLKAFIQNGVIDRETAMETINGSKGKAGQIKGLFPSLPKPASPPPIQLPDPESTDTPLFSPEGLQTIAADIWAILTTKSLTLAQSNQKLKILWRINLVCLALTGLAALIGVPNGGIILIIPPAIALLVFFIWALIEWNGQSSACPKCEKLNAKREVTRQKVGLVKKMVKRTKYVRNSKGETIASSEYEVPVTEHQDVVTFRCRHCQHRWQETQTYTTEGWSNETVENNVNDIPQHEAVAVVNYKSIHEAAAANDTEAVARYLRVSASVFANQLDIGESDMPLHRAAKNNAAEVIPILLKAGADVNVKDKCGLGYQPLHLAVENGAVESIIALIKGGADINAKGGLYSRNTPLYSATIHRSARSAETITTLIEAGANVKERRREGRTLLHIAAEMNAVESLTALIKAGGNVNEDDGPDGNTPLHRAAEKGAAEAITVLIEAGANVNVRNSRCRSPVQLATGKGYSILTAAGANVGTENNHDFASLYDAAAANNPEAIVTLIKAGVDVKVKNNLLHGAALKNAAESITALLKAGADVNAKDSHGRTPLWNATSNGNVEAVTVLLKAGADVNVKDNDDYAPLHRAAMKGAAEAITVLIEAGADVNAKGSLGCTPLHWACTETAATAVLLKAGANVNARDGLGDTPLHHAIKYCKTITILIETITILIEAGADVNARNTSGETPLQLAEKKNYTEAIAILTEAAKNTEMKKGNGTAPANPYDALNAAENTEPSNKVNDANRHEAAKAIAALNGYET